MQKTAIITVMAGAVALTPLVSRADTAGDAMLTKCIEAESHLSTLQCNFTLQGSGMQTEHGTLILKKPNIAQIEIDSSASKLISHSDGKTLITYSTDANQYSRQPADVTGGNVVRDCELLEAATFFNPDLLDRMRFGHNAKLVATATLLGTQCRVVQVNGAGGGEWKVFIGPDNLLRGYSEKLKQNGQLVTRDSRITGLKIGASISQAALNWSLPKGAKTVEEVATARSQPTSGTSPEEQGLLPVGKPAPGFTLPVMGGKSVTLAEAVKTNRVTLVNFWSSYCGPCRAELPELSKMLEQLRGKGLDIYSVNLGDTEATVSKIWKEGRYGMHAVLDGNKVAQQYQIEAIPTNYVVAPDGKILARFVGFDMEGIKGALAKAGIK